MSQPRGSVSRASNIVWTRRGGIKVCDGTAIITNSSLGILNSNSNFGPITEIFLFQPTNGPAAYYGIVKDPGTHLNGPAASSAAGAAGVLTGNYRWEITALDGAGGESTVGAESSVLSLTAQKGTVTWTPVPNASGGYNIYRTVAGGASGTEKFVATVTGQSSSSFTDNVSDGGLGGSPPLVNTTQVCEFFNFNFPSYSALNIINTFPADNLPYQGGGTGGGRGGSGSGGGGNSGFQPPNSSGGVSGNLSPLPQIVQFVNKMILALGNGFAPYISDGTSSGTVVISNTFTAAYPTWTASTVYTQGDQIQATVSAVAYVFTAVQGGTSGSGGAPAFPAALGATVTDNNIIWKNSGQVSGSPAPRGAAHAEVYAGSVWFANTSPTVTTDQLDGPSALRMSLLNNPNSWNPLNAAQISPDDGDQGSGLKAFTVAEAGIAPQNFLIYFKNFSTYLIQGVFGASNFAITRLQTDLGCIAPRTIQFIPGFGIMRLSHLGFAVTDGISDKLENPEAIRPYLISESTESDILPLDQGFIYFSKGAQTADPPMYVAACPLQGKISSDPLLFNGVTVTIINTVSNGLPLGTYFLIVQATLTSGLIFLSGEFSVTLVFSPHGSPAIQVTLPNNPTVATWTIYLTHANGSAGGENQFVTVNNGITVVNIVGTTVLTPGTPPRNLGGQLTRIFCYDLVLKAWTVVDLPFSISVLRQFRTPGSIPITVMGGFFDGVLRRWQAGDPAWDAGATVAGAITTAVSWNFTDTEVYTEGATVRMFHNQVIIRADGSPSRITVTPEINGKIQQAISAALTVLGEGQVEARVRIMQTAENLELAISGQGPAVIESIDYNVQPKPAGAPLVFS
jgi:hypothetical protein